LSESKSGPSNITRGGQRPGGLPRLLFVDDEENIRLTLPLILQRHGFDPTAVASVADALVQIAAVTFDVLLTDLNIDNEGDGFLVITAMRRAQPRCKNFILTGYPGLENAIRAIQSQVDDYFTKPTDVEEIVAKIKARLTGPPAMPVKLSSVLMEQEPEIVGKILQALKRDALVGKARISDDERVDHIPSIFEAIIERLMHDNRALTSKNLQFAARHGRRRKKDRYTAAMLMREFQLIGETIYDLLGSDIMPLGAVELTSDLKMLTQSLNTLTLASLEAYSRAR
jgi:DNA-binding response OmpR family regulator